TGIVVTSDLDEYAIAALRSAPVDAYGVGTQLVTGSGAPTASLVYKLTTRQDRNGNWIDVQKQAEGKTSRGGRKFAARRMDSGVATAEVVIAGQEPQWDANHRPLQVKVVDGGEIQTQYIGSTAVEQAAAHHKQAVSELPRAARRLQDGEPAIPTVFELH
ncbi:MAG: nicotinate phosphoribosyltransferase, partial [Yaniella sp.]|nr:nicotinate phosphoribosyltransferase [Yaniella sp.]